MAKLIFVMPFPYDNTPRMTRREAVQEARHVGRGVIAESISMYREAGADFNDVSGVKYKVFDGERR